MALSSIGTKLCATDVRDAALGCISGALIGDAIGAHLEFFGRRIEEADVHEALQMNGGGCWRLGPGQYTDDGEMTVSSLMALGEQAGPFSPGKHAAAYRQWLLSAPFDIGITTSQGLAPLRSPLSTAADCYAASARLNGSSQSNGALMRISPMAVWANRLVGADLAAFAKAVCFDVTFTHSDAFVHECCVSYCVAIATLLQSDRLGERQSARDAARLWVETHAAAKVTFRKEQLTLKMVWQLLIDEESISDEQLGVQQSMGWALWAYVLAFRHLQRGTIYSDAIRSVVALGGDTDTNACIVGALIGAADGYAHIPTYMRHKLSQFDSTFVNGRADGRGQTRPPHFSGRFVDQYVDLALQAAPQAPLAFADDAPSLPAQLAYLWS